MATKAERFKAAEQRKGPGPSTGEARKKTRVPSTARNESKHASRKAAYALEDVVPPSSRPSRKSTRKSGNRQKHASALKNRQTMRTRSPRARAEKAAATAVK